MWPGVRRALANSTFLPTPHARVFYCYFATYLYFDQTITPASVRVVLGKIHTTYYFRFAKSTYYVSTKNA